ncbi:hypothetical protein ACFL2F_04970 [Myxococcota bacterium]
MARALMTTFALVIIATGCTTSQTNAAGEGAAKPEKTKAQVSRIVFVGMKDACQCTRDRIAASWAALEAVLGRDPAIPVERIQEDVDAAKADEYAKLKAIIVVPGIYFLDEKGKLVELLQGEVSPKQVTAVLQSAGKS